MGNGSFYSGLSEPQGVSAWWNETVQTQVFLLSLSLLLNHLEPQSSKAQFLLPIMPIDIAGYTFTLLWNNLCPSSCIWKTVDVTWQFKQAGKKFAFHSLLCLK